MEGTALYDIIKRNPSNYKVIKKAIRNSIYISDKSFLDLCDKSIRQKVIDYVNLKKKDVAIEKAVIPTCVRCNNNVAIIMVIPCNHLALCSECCLKECPNEIRKECPVCNMPNDSYMRVFF